MSIKKIFNLILLCLSAAGIYAQDFYEPEYIVNMDSTVFNPSTRQINVGRNQAVQPVNPRWSKTVYRFVSFKDTAEIAANSFLAEPRSPILYYTQAGEAAEKRYYYNFISIILRLLDEKKIGAFSFDTQSVNETFTRNEYLTPDSALMKLGLNRTRRKREFDQADLTYAGSGVIGYMLKEVWYVDGHTSQFGCAIEALAPIIPDGDNVNEFTPVFWITYRSLQPYLPYLEIHSDTPGLTFDAYFKKRMYQGLIYKVQNPQNKILWSDCEKEVDSYACRKIKSDQVQAEIDQIPSILWDTPLKNKELTGKGKRGSNQK
ncbi:MAG: hypothetical protein ACRCXN_04415 [Bacteroidales bacterium]